MKHSKTLTCAALIGCAALFLGPSGGQDGNYAGAPGDNGTCSASNGGCHTGGTPGGFFTLAGITNPYLRGATYPIQLTLNDNSGVVGGFQIVATNGSTNAMVGTFTPGADNRLTVPTGRLTHDAPKAFSGGSVSWSFDWSAPNSNPPALLRFYIVGNAANSNGGSDGDWIVVSTFSANLLPVELASFSAKNMGDGTVALAWQTLSEANCDRFEVERAEGDGPFSPIGEVRGQGNSTERHDYSFRDRPAFFEKTTARYRLRQVDFDGQATHSGVESVEVGASKCLSVAPNLARAGERVSVRFSGLEAGAVVEAVDFSGRVLFSKKLGEEDGGSLLLETGGWPGGRYSIRVGAGGGAVAVPFLLL